MVDLFEELAAIQHDIWSHWQQWMHSVCKRNPDGSLTIPATLVERLERQIRTPYSELSAKEKNSDRDQVRRYWRLVRPGKPKGISRFDRVPTVGPGHIETSVPGLVTWVTEIDSDPAVLSNAKTLLVCALQVEDARKLASALMAGAAESAQALIESQDRNRAKE